MSSSAASTNLVSIGGRRLHMASFGQGTPSVIVEAGLGDAVVESGSWDTVLQEVAKTTRVCIYDRAGLGKSDGVANPTRTCADFASDLRLLLIHAKVPPPYIMVGHSIGGCVVRIYASKFPDEVAGIVLVDSFNPDLWSGMLGLMPPESPQEPDAITETRALLRKRADHVNARENLERLDFNASDAEVRAAGDLGSKPLIVISHSRTWSPYPSLPRSLADKLEELLDQWQNDMCRLSTNSTRVIAEKAGHFVQRDEPRLVIDAILEIVAANKERQRCCSTAPNPSIASAWKCKIPVSTPPRSTER